MKIFQKIPSKSNPFQLFWGVSWSAVNLTLCSRLSFKISILYSFAKLSQSMKMHLYFPPNSFEIDHPNPMQKYCLFYPNWEKFCNFSPSLHICSFLNHFSKRKHLKFVAIKTSKEWKLRPLRFCISTIHSSVVKWLDGKMGQLAVCKTWLNCCIEGMFQGEKI